MTQRFRRGLALLLAAAILPVTTWNAHADPAERVTAAAPIARVIQQAGPVEVRRDDAKLASHLGRLLYAGDSVVTGEGGRLLLEFTDRSLLALGSRTEVRLDDYAIENASGSLKGLLSLLGGILRMSIVQTTKAENFSVRTQTAVASARSTDWIVEAQPSETTVFVLSGVVTVADASRSTSVRVSPGEGTSVALTAAEGPTTPKIWGAKRAADALSRTGIE
ncbi:MAG: FecR domain-containing protein [Kiloniellales bacterium]|nr:FecR domain-containing protein [Kiloniellales bacterium]